MESSCLVALMTWMTSSMTADTSRPHSHLGPAGRTDGLMMATGSCQVYARIGLHVKWQRDRTAEKESGGNCT